MGSTSDRLPVELKILFNAHVYKCKPIKHKNYACIINSFYILQSISCIDPSFSILFLVTEIWILCVFYLWFYLSNFLSLSHSLFLSLSFFLTLSVVFSLLLFLARIRGVANIMGAANLTWETRILRWRRWRRRWRRAYHVGDALHGQRPLATTNPTLGTPIGLPSSWGRRILRGRRESYVGDAGGDVGNAHTTLGTLYVANVRCWGHQ